MVKLGNDWDEILKDEWEKNYYKKLRAFLKNEYSSRTIYPHMNDIFNALKFTSFKDTKVVIIGQDPYHGEGQAHGLYSFGDGRWLISHKKSTPEGQCSYIYPYLWDNTHPFGCEITISE